jgi:hypothetical protein
MVRGLRLSASCALRQLAAVQQAWFTTRSTAPACRDLDGAMWVAETESRRGGRRIQEADTIDARERLRAEGVEAAQANVVQIHENFSVHSERDGAVFPQPARPSDLDQLEGVGGVGRADLVRGDEGRARASGGTFGGPVRGAGESGRAIARPRRQGRRLLEALPRGPEVDGKLPCGHKRRPQARSAKKRGRHLAAPPPSPGYQDLAVPSG